MSRPKSQAIYDQMCQLIPGGVNSPVRAFYGMGQPPMVIESGSKDMIVDADGNSYIDLCGSWGSLIHGHAHPSILNAIQARMAKGTSFGITTPIEGELAAEVIKLVTSVERIRFVSSGTEATMSAARLARGYTKRDYIIKFNGNYHGHADFFLVQAGSSLIEMCPSSSSAGIPADIVKHTISLPYNDIEACKKVFANPDFSNKIAAVIFKPLEVNMNFLSKMFGTVTKTISTAAIPTVTAKTANGRGITLLSKNYNQSIQSQRIEFSANNLNILTQLALKRTKAGNADQSTTHSAQQKNDNVGIFPLSKFLNLAAPKDESDEITHPIFHLDPNPIDRNPPSNSLNFTPLESTHFAAYNDNLKNDLSTFKDQLTAGQLNALTQQFHLSADDLTNIKKILTYVFSNNARKGFQDIVKRANIAKGTGVQLNKISLADIVYDTKASAKKGVESAFISNMCAQLKMSLAAHYRKNEKFEEMYKSLEDHFKMTLFGKQSSLYNSVREINNNYDELVEASKTIGDLYTKSCNSEPEEKERNISISRYNNLLSSFEQGYKNMETEKVLALKQLRAGEEQITNKSIKDLSSTKNNVSINREKKLLEKFESIYFVLMDKLKAEVNSLNEEVRNRILVEMGSTVAKKDSNELHGLKAKVKEASDDELKALKILIKEVKSSTFLSTGFIAQLDRMLKPWKLSSVDSN